KVLLKEMQSLALEVNVVSEEGQRAEMRDEDDDLLRAAEELGIDLSAVGLLAGDASDEELEGEDNTDAAAPDAAATGEAGGEEGDTGDDAVADEDLIAVAGAGEGGLESLASEETAE